jgi:hypothetical protein
VTVSGTLVDERGKPVPRVIVAASLSPVGGQQDASFRTSVLTDKDGTFRLRLPRGRGYYLLAYPF